MGVSVYLFQNLVAAFFVSAGVLTNNLGALLGGMLLSPLLEVQYFEYLALGVVVYVAVGFVLQSLADDMDESIYLKEMKTWKDHFWFYMLIPFLLGVLIKTKVELSLLLSLVVSLAITVTPAFVSAGIFVAKSQPRNAVTSFQLGIANIILYFLGFLLF